MKSWTVRCVVLWVVCAALAPVAWSQLEPVNLRCEYLSEPIGLDAPSPRLSWELKSSLRAQRQTAYQVIVASSPDALAREQADLWDTGRIDSQEQNQIAYSGQPLVSHQVCYWKVRVWNQDGRESGWSDSSSWSMGVVRPEDWKGKWITSDLDGSGAMPLFRKEFSIDKPVRRAIAYVCGLGVHEFRVNGKPSGKAVLEPAWTNYRKTCVYSSYDLTSSLSKGPNVLGVMLGNGMYNIPGGRYVKFKGSFGKPMVNALVHIEYQDGTAGEIVTDSTWKTAPGPIVFSCVYGGEDYDARQESAGWDAPGFSDASWKPAVESAGPGGALTSDAGPPIQVMEVRKATEITQPKSGVFVYDLAKNTSGWPILRVKGPRGATVKLIPGELLDDNGLVTQRSSGGPVSFSYTLKGKGVESWRPQFSYYGFRYVQVEGATPDRYKEKNTKGPILLELSADFTYAAAEPSGEFSCSNETVNRIHDLILTAIRSNFQSVLTDCPHREKLGWLEVSHLLAGGILYNFDAPRFYAKVSRDIRDSQRDNGLVPDIAPEYTVFNGGFVDSPEWGSASILNPWNVYLHYGDSRILDANYETMKRYAAYLGSMATDSIVSHGLGDWYDIGPKGPGESQLTSKGLTATAVYYQDLVTLSKAALVLGKTEDARAFTEQASRVREAFNRKFYRKDTHEYDMGSQTALAMPLALNLVPEADRPAVLDRLTGSIRAGGHRVTAGDVGFSYLVRALTDGGAPDVLYNMVIQDDGPGYVDQLNKNATALTEAWDASPTSSNNHCMLGHAEEWLYRGLGGIRLEENAPAFRHVILHPEVPAGLQWVKVRHESIRGPILSEWIQENGSFSWDIHVPPNSTATVYVPSANPDSVMESDKPAAQAPGVRFLRFERQRAVFHVESGSYRFVVRRSEQSLHEN